jgi:hypothetical protein
MPALLIYPGTRGTPVPLQDVLREAHDAYREARKAQIEGRRKRRVPLDDSTDWKQVTESVAGVSLALTDRDSAKLAREARLLAELTEGNALEEVGPYEPDPALEGILVTMQVVADADRRLWNAETQAQWARVRECRVSGDLVGAQSALNALDAIAARVVSAIVVEVSGIEGMKATIAESMPGLTLAGLLAPLYQAARHFLELPVGKAVRCGLQPLST